MAGSRATPRILLCVVWVGFDDNRDLGSGRRTRQRAPVWAEFMKRAVTLPAITTRRISSRRPGIVQETVDPQTWPTGHALLPADHVQEYFIAGASRRSTAMEPDGRPAAAPGSRICFGGGRVEPTSCHRRYFWPGASNAPENQSRLAPGGSRQPCSPCALPTTRRKRACWTDIWYLWRKQEPADDSKPQVTSRKSLARLAPKEKGHESLAFFAVALIFLAGTAYSPASTQCAPWCESPPIPSTTAPRRPENDSPTNRSLRCAADIMMARKEFEAAAKVYEIILHDDPKNAQVLNLWGGMSLMSFWGRPASQTAPNIITSSQRLRIRPTRIALNNIGTVESQTEALRESH